MLLCASRKLLPALDPLNNMQVELLRLNRSRAASDRAP